MSNSRKPLQLVFCVETTNSAKTDRTYMNCIIDYHFPRLRASESIKISYIHLCGKTNFDKRSIEKVILELTKNYQKFSGGSSEIFYVLDKDNFTINPQDASFVKRVEQHCSCTNRNLIWFVKDIEHVLVGRQISNGEKKKVSLDFSRLNQITSISKEVLSVKDPKSDGTSNVIAIINDVLEKYNEAN